MNANIDTFMFLSSGRGGIGNKYTILIGLNRVRGRNVRGAKRPILLFSTGNPSISALVKSTRTSQLLTKNGRYENYFACYAGLKCIYSKFMGKIHLLRP